VVPLCAVLQLNHGAQKGSKSDTPVSVIEQVKEPSKAFVNVIRRKKEGLIRRSLPTVSAKKLES
jgi:hypothetical protein